MRTPSVSSQRNQGPPAPLSKGPDTYRARRYLSIIPTGICGVTNDAGDVDCEYEGSGVSGVVGCVRYPLRGLWGVGVDFCGDA